MSLEILILDYIRQILKDNDKYPLIFTKEDEDGKVLQE